MLLSRGWQLNNSKRDFTNWNMNIEINWLKVLDRHCCAIYVLLTYFIDAFFKINQKFLDAYATPVRSCYKPIRHVTESDDGDQFRFHHCDFTHTQKSCKQKYLLSKWMKKWSKNEYHNLFIVARILNVFPSAAFEWNSWGSIMTLPWHSSITTFEVMDIYKMRLACIIE